MLIPSERVPTTINADDHQLDTSKLGCTSVSPVLNGAHTEIVEARIYGDVEIQWFNAEGVLIDHPEPPEKKLKADIFFRCTLDGVSLDAQEGDDVKMNKLQTLFDLSVFGVNTTEGKDRLYALNLQAKTLPVLLVYHGVDLERVYAGWQEINAQIAAQIEALEGSADA